MRPLTAHDLADSAPLPRLPIADGAVRVQILRTPSEIEALGPAWRALEAQSSGAILFQSHAWCARIAAQPTPREPAIVAAYDSDRLIGLLPMKLVAGRMGRIATGLGEPFQQYSDLLLPAGTDGASVLAAMVATLRSQAGVDAIVLTKVRADSALHAAMTTLDRGSKRIFQPARQVDGAPFVDLAPFAQFGDFHRTINAKTRKNIRNARNRAGRGGSLEVEVHERGQGLAAIIARAHTGRSDWLEREGQVSRAFSDPGFAGLIEDFADPDRSGLQTLAVSLSAGDVPIADQWGFVHRGRYYAYVATWNRDYEESSPGKLIMEDVLRACHDRAIGIADFLMPAARYKFTWASDSVEVRDWSAPLTGRGRAITLWMTRGRPMLRTAFFALPPGVRAFVKRCLAVFPGPSASG